MAVPWQLVSFGVQKLYDQLSHGYKQIRGVDDEVTLLENKLKLLSAFLQNIHAKKLADAVVRTCVEEINEIICDAEDIFDTFLVKKPFFIKKPFSRRKLALDVASICERITKVNEDMTNFGVQQTVAGPGYIVHHLHDSQRKRQTFAREDERDIVGLEENVEELVRNLVENDDTEVVSITGMGGIGKTTLARHVFNHKEVQRHFQGFAWVCVSREFTTISVWQTILRNLRPKEEGDEIMKMTEPQLQDKLYNLLKTSKALIVLDDIWNQKDWGLIKKIFPKEKGWKVLLTSRKQSLAVRRDKTYINFKAECLNHVNSLTLFRRIAFPTIDASELMVDEERKEMEEMGGQMIEHCGGLPLAIKVLGGLLAEKYTLDDWRRVAKDIGSRLVGRISFDDEENGPLNHIFSLSFEELPVSMKHCFLYLAQFPEDFVINIDELSYQWATEGFLPLPDSSTTTHVAYEYIEELVRRNMVILEGERHTSLLKETCRLHDIVREICLLKAKEDNFLQLASTSFSTADSQPSSSSIKPKSSGTSRRFFLHHPTRLEVEREINNSKLRSLVVVGYHYMYPKTWILSAKLCFKRLQLLRRLDLSGAEFEGKKLPSSIGKLILLKYLNLKGAKVSHLPKSLRHLKLLIYLNLGLEGEICVPNVLSEMQELRFLWLPREMHKKTKLELSKLVKLETLMRFSTANCNIGDLHGMTRLITLEIYLSKKTSRIETLSASISGWEKLEVLSITDQVACTYDGIAGFEGIELDSLNLKILVLEMYMPRFRTQQPFPSGLTSLTLGGCWLEEDPMPILEKLLHLKELFIRALAFRGKKMVCSANGYPQLRVLLLNGLPNLEEWIIENGSMSLLHTLDIIYCRELKELPDGLESITSLKDLKCLDMGGRGWKVSLSEGGSQFHKVKHIPSITLYAMDDDDDDDGVNGNEIMNFFNITYLFDVDVDDDDDDW